MKNKLIIVGFIILFFGNSFSQTDTAVYTLFNKKLIFYTDFGYSSAPFSVSFPYSSSLSKIRFKHNFRSILGLGMSYRWFAVRLGIPLSFYTRPISKFGETKPFNIGFDFTLKKIHCEVDLRSFRGYAIQNALQWNDSLTPSLPNEIRPSVESVSFSTNVWYFNHKDFKIAALKGKTGHYNKRVHTWYLKNTLNIFGIRDDEHTLIPAPLQNPIKPQTAASFYNALDLGVVPGYAYVERIGNWQLAIMGGFGGVVQSKFYGGSIPSRGFLGLAPRYDVRFFGGYSVPNYFIFLLTDFDNKSIRFSNLVYRQHFYSIKIVAGKRFQEKNKKRSAKV